MCSSCKCKIFSAQLKCTANGISVQNVNILPNLWSHFGNFSLHTAQSLEVSKIRGKNKKNFETCWLSIINKGNFSKFFLFFPLIFETSSDCAICKEKFPKCDHRFGNTFTFCTDISYIYVKNLNT